MASKKKEIKPCSKCGEHPAAVGTYCGQCAREFGLRVLDELRRDEMQADGLWHESYDPDIIEEPRNTDAGNAIRFAKMWYEDVLYVPEAKSWFIWTGKVWQQDVGEIEMLRMAKRTVQRLFITAASKKDEAVRNGQLKWAMASESQARLLAMVQSAKSVCRTFHYPDFDKDPLLFNAANFTIDLKTGEVRKHNRDDYMTKLSPVSYDRIATCSRWIRFLEEIMPGHETCCIPSLQRAIGYTMTAKINEECFFVLWGSGRNGKSKLIETIRYLLGDYVKGASFDTFVARKGDEKLNDIAGFRGSRCIIASESEHSKRLAESKIKRMTGDEAVTAEFKYQEQFDYTPQYKIWLITNYKPKIVGTDDGIWDRTHLLPFTRYFTAEERDLDLGEKLKAEAAGILNWAIEGALAWQQQRLSVPDCVKQATSAYRAEQNVLGQFIEDRCEVGDDMWVGKLAMHTAYKGWAEAVGEFVMPLAEFGERLQMKFDEGKSGPRGRHWIGVRVKSEYSFEQEALAKAAEEDSEQVKQAVKAVN